MLLRDVEAHAARNGGRLVVRATIVLGTKKNAITTIIQIIVATMGT